MNLTLKLNARFQPKHRFDLEDALQEILEEKQLGEITGGGTAQNPDGEIAYCDIEIQLTNDKSDRVQWLANLLNRIGSMYSYWEGNTYTALYFYGSSFAEMKKRIEPFISTYPLCQKCRIEQIA